MQYNILDKEIQKLQTKSKKKEEALKNSEEMLKKDKQEIERHMKISKDGME